VELQTLQARAEYALVGGPFGSELTQADYVQEGVPVIRGSNMGGDQGQFVDDGFVYVTEAKARDLRRNLAFPGDLVFTQRGTLGQVAVIPLNAKYQSYVISQSQMKVTPAPELVDRSYLHHYFRSPGAVSRLLRETQATGVPHINLGILKRSVVVLPPVAEQRRIAEVLDRAEALRAKRRAALALLDTLTHSIFLDLFGDPRTNPKGMRREELGSVVKVRSGAFLPATAMKAGPYPVYGGNGISGTHDAYMFESSQIAVGRVGVYCGCVHVTAPNSWITDNALYVSECSDALSPAYLAHALETADLNKLASQSGQPLISASRIYPLKILVPPLPLQQTFARRAAAVEKLKAAHRASLARLDELFASLQHRAFRGEL
jgi:type I restriction enzyme S subunit